MDDALITIKALSVHDGICHDALSLQVYRIYIWHHCCEKLRGTMILEKVATTAEDKYKLDIREPHRLPEARSPQITGFM